MKRRTPESPETETESNGQSLSSLLVKEELKRERNKIRFRRIIKYTVNTMIVVAAIAVLITSLLLPVLQISGTSMEPTLRNGDIVVLVKTSNMDRGDLCGFSYSNKILIKRVIGLPGDIIFIESDGTVYVNGILADEPYLADKGLGECDIEFPYTVPENTFFLMGDHRTTSIDSRSTVIGCVPYEQIVGKLFFRVWPFEEIGVLS
ncbi:MAG: signal peptidase I [Ruminococcaceae bacterium]|nr:signal peptidase I [Oscillospiraceae bacterium]